jgi:hypothetical protein
MIVSQSDENLKQLLEGLARNEILVAEGARLKLDVPKQQVDSVRNEIRKQLRTAVVEGQLTNIKPQEGESMDQAVERRVMALLEGNIKGDRAVIPLGPISHSLREQFGAQVFEQGVTATVQKAEQLRAQSAPTAPSLAPPGGQSPAQPTPGQPAPTQPAPSTTTRE